MNRNKKSQQSSKSAAKPQAKSTRAQKSGRQSASSMSTSTNQAVGSANMTSNRQPTYIRRAAAPFHPKWGAGQRVNGKQYLTTITTTAVDASLFQGNSPASTTLIYISPDAFNGRLALEARTYQRYLFTKLRLIYTPRVATTQPGEMVLGVYSDGAAASFFTPSFTNVQDSEAAIVSSFHNGGQQLIWDLPLPRGQEDSYFCELDTASLAGQRQSIQAQLMGFADASNLGAITQGNLSIEYEILFYCPSSDLGFTTSLKRIASQEEADVLAACQAEYRKKVELKLDCSSSSVSATPRPPPEVRGGRWITL